LRANINEVVASGKNYRRWDGCEHAILLLKETPQAEVIDKA